MKLYKLISKYTAKALTGLLVVTMAASLSSCEDYLNIKPKKQEIPVTLEDFTAFFNNESQTMTPHSYMTHHESYIFGEYYYPYIVYYGETDFDYILYYWTDGDRYEGTADNQCFNRSYRGIAVANQIIDGVGDAEGCSEADKQSAIASARIIRVLHYFHMTQMFCHAYDPATAAQELGVPFILHSGPDVDYTQPTLKELYDWMIDELTDVIECESLPNFGATILIPGKGAAYAAMARVQLHMRNYEEAKKYAEKALDVNGELVDWVQVYNDNYDEYFNPWSSERLFPSQLQHSCCENYYYGHGNYNTSKVATMQLPKEAGEQFEKGDCFFKCNWNIAKKITNNQYYYSAAYGYFNNGGLRSVEQYFIKAECQARLGDVSGACNTLNYVRKRYIDAENYADFVTTDKGEAICKIRDFKHSTLIHNVVNFADAKRFNSEGLYPFIPKKKIKNQVVYLEPDSRHWTLPFPQNVITSTLHGVVTQIELN